MKQVITEQHIIAAAKGSKVIAAEGEYLLTPLAKDKAKELGVTVSKAEESCNNTQLPQVVSKKIAIGCDHTGYKLKKVFIDILKQKKIEVIDVGTHSEESCDYPDYAILVAKHVALKEACCGIMIDATGIPSAITANKFPGIFAATCYNEFTAKSAKEHNNANVMVLGAKAIGEETAKSILGVWLNTSFAGGRHERRLNKIKAVEKAFIRKELH